MGRLVWGASALLLGGLLWASIFVGPPLWAQACCTFDNVYVKRQLNLLPGATTNISGGGGGVTTTGSPASGNLTVFSGASTITNTDLSGDISTLGTNVTTLATVNGNVGTFTNMSATVNAKGLITAAASGNKTPTASASTTYNLATTDCFTTVVFSASGAVAVSATTAAGGIAGCVVGLLQNGTGKVSPTAGAGVTANTSAVGTGTRAQGSIVYVLYTDSTHYTMVGDGA